MKKFIIISESQKERLFEDLITEIANLSDIYQKYYANKLEEDIFYQLIKLDPSYNQDNPNKMGKYGKWIINLYLNKNLKLEDLYKVTDYLKYFIKYYNRIPNKDINIYKTLPDLYDAISEFKEAEENGEDIATSKSDEIRRIKSESEVFYEDSKWLVIIPRSQEASCYYGKGTQWCTAAERSNNMFDKYASEGDLYINIDKETGRKYQFHFESSSFMDERDYEIITPIAKRIGLTETLVEEYYRHYGGLALIYLTSYCDPSRGVKGEEPYYYYETEDGYGSIVTTENGVIRPLLDDIISENEVQYLGKYLFSFKPEEMEEDYYDEYDDENYVEEESLPIIFNAKERRKYTVTNVEDPMVTNFNKKYILVLGTYEKAILRKSDLSEVFRFKKDKNLTNVQTIDYTLNYKGYFEEIYGSDIVVISTNELNDEGNYSFGNVLYNLVTRQYIAPPDYSPTKYRLTRDFAGIVNAYVIYYNPLENEKWYLLPNGTLSQEKPKN